MGGQGQKHRQGLMATGRVDLSPGRKVSELKGKFVALGLPTQGTRGILR